MAVAKPQDKEATLAVFPGEMGSVKANVNGWFGKFTPVDGRPKGNPGRQSEKQVDGMDVMLADISGTFDANMGMSLQENTPPVENYRMLGAIVDFGAQVLLLHTHRPNEQSRAMNREF